MGKRTRSDSLMRKPYEYIGREDRLQMPHGISIPRVGGGNQAFVALRQYGRKQPVIRQDWNRATVTIVRGNRMSTRGVLIRVRNRIRAIQRKLDPTRDWSDEVLMEAYAIVEAAGQN